jgi:hypothetical protein
VESPAAAGRLRSPSPRRDLSWASADTPPTQYVHPVPPSISIRSKILGVCRSPGAELGIRIRLLLEGRVTFSSSIRAARLAYCVCDTSPLDDDTWGPRRGEAPLSRPFQPVLLTAHASRFCRCQLESAVSPSDAKRIGGPMLHCLFVVIALPHWCVGVSWVKFGNYALGLAWGVFLLKFCVIATPIILRSFFLLYLNKSKQTREPHGFALIRKKEGNAKKK